MIIKRSKASTEARFPAHSAQNVEWMEHEAIPPGSIFQMV